MKIYRIKIKTRSSFITPWHSDTVFGSLCWCLVQAKGQDRLNELLNQFKEGKYPFVISNGFYGDYLPKPLLGNRLSTISDLNNREEAIKIFKKAKSIKKIKELSLNEFNAVINCGYIELEEKKKLNIDAQIAHNQVSRVSNTTEEGALYEEYESFMHEDSYISMYFCVSGEWYDDLCSMFELLALKGFGKAASRGKGAFFVEDISEFNGFDIPCDPNSYIIMSNYIPKKNEPIIGQYKCFVKCGKLGGEYAASNNPFKKPIMMISPGAVFMSKAEKYACGRVIERVSNEHKNVIGFGCSLCIPSRIKFEPL